MNSRSASTTTTPALEDSTGAVPASMSGGAMYAPSSRARPWSTRPGRPSTDPRRSVPAGVVSRNLDAAPHASPMRSASPRIRSKSTASGPSSRNVSSRTPGIARYRTPIAVASLRAALDPMNRLVSSITAPASRIWAATSFGGSAPGSAGTGIVETTGTPRRCSIPATNPATTAGSVPASVSRTTCSPSRTARQRSSTLANPTSPSIRRHAPSPDVSASAANTA